MPGSKFNHQQLAVLDAAFGSGSPATWYLALYTVAPTAGGGGTEVSGGAYARVAVTNNTSNFPAATGSGPATKLNGAAFTFPTATATWGNVVAFGWFDAASGGNGGYWGLLNAVRLVNAADTPSFAVGALAVTET